MNLIQRVQDILLRPSVTWRAIADEPGDTASLYKNYVAILALIPAVAGFIGMSIVGVGLGILGGHYREPIGVGLVSMVLGYVLSIAGIYVLGLIIDALASSFGGTKNAAAAHKVAAYASTAALVGGVFSLIPAFGMLGLLAGLYSIYLIYLGLPALMKSPADKTVGYTAVAAICAIVVSIVLTGVVTLVRPSPLAGMGGAPHVSIETPDGKLAIDTDKLQEMAKRIEEAGKKAAEAEARGDEAAAIQAAARATTAVVDGKPFEAQVLRAALPEAIGALARDSIDASQIGEGTPTMSMAHAEYRSGDQRLRLGISDGGFDGVALWSLMTFERETGDKVERVYKQGKRSVMESYRKDRSLADYKLVLENGLLVEGSGEHIDIDTLRAAVNGLDLARLEAMKRDPA